jgi:hypothetical protein
LLPNYVCIGAQRAGTTWIHNCLREHPEVLVPQEKECHFFDENFEKGVAWYEKKFRVTEGAKAVVDVTPNYLDVPDAAPRMATIIPLAKLFVVLRDPVSRAYSAYTLFRSRFEGLSFREACEQRPYLIDLGMYHKHLSRFFRYYPREQIRVFFYQQLENSPDAFLRDLFAFLGADPTFHPPSARSRPNRVIFPGIQNALRKAGLGWGIELVKRTALGNSIRQIQAARSSFGTELSGDDIRYFRGVFGDDVRKLEKMLDCDLSSWL